MPKYSPTEQDYKDLLKKLFRRNAETAHDLTALEYFSRVKAPRRARANPLLSLDYWKRPERSLTPGDKVRIIGLRYGSLT